MIRPVRAAYGEYPVFLIFEKRLSDELFLFRTVKMIDQDNMRKTFYIL